MRSESGKSPDKWEFSLQLFVAGTTPRSQQAIKSVKRMCEDEFGSSNDLQIIDIYQQPKLLRGEQIIAVPALVRNSPSPRRRVVGDMTNERKIVAGLEIRRFKDLVP